MRLPEASAGGLSRVERGTAFLRRVLPLLRALVRREGARDATAFALLEAVRLNGCQRWSALPAALRLGPTRAADAEAEAEAAREKLAEAQAQAEAEAAGLAATRRDLAAARAELQSVREALVRSQRELDGCEAARGAACDELARSRAELAHTDRSLRATCAALAATDASRAASEAALRAAAAGLSRARGAAEEGDERSEEEDECREVPPPPRPPPSAHPHGDSDDLDDGVVLVGASGGLLMRDLPHTRANCPLRPFAVGSARRTVGGNEAACTHCWCYVCQCPVAECCHQWTLLDTALPAHCNAHGGGNGMWKSLKLKRGGQTETEQAARRRRHVL